MSHSQCVLSLSDSQMGVIVLPTVLYLSKVLAKLAMGLDRRPELIAQLLRLEGRSDEDESIEKVTLVERSANVVREAFIKCLTDRSGTPGVQGKPEGRRIGIYLMANLCLKLLFQVFTLTLRCEIEIANSTSVVSFAMRNRCLPVSAPSPLPWRIFPPHNESPIFTISDATFFRTTFFTPRRLPCKRHMTSATGRR